MTKLLLVEDEEHIYTGLIFNLELEGYEVTHAKDGNIAKEILFDNNEIFDLILLDIMIPGMNGYDLCHALRKNKNYTPVLMLTAKSFDKDKIRCLQSGADDYITKPFNLEELLTRIQVILRRQHWINQSLQDEVLKFGNVVIDFEKFFAQVGDEEVKLTNLEFKLMKLFYDNEGKVLSREDIFEKVWDVKDYLGMRSVDNFVARLRKYFEIDPSNPQYFQSVRGVGYKFIK
ncbi:MAG: response regulator transcription factor [Candidatus Sericytochromatia bacterium]